MSGGIPEDPALIQKVSRQWNANKSWKTHGRTWAFRNGC